MQEKGTRFGGRHAFSLAMLVPLLSAAACMDQTVPTALSVRGSASTDLVAAGPPGPDTSRYIIVLKPSVSDASATAASLVNAFHGQLLRVFQTGTKAVVLRGLPPGALAAIKQLPDVD